MYWAHEGGENLEAGSGLFIGPEGYVDNHHFMLTEGSTTYQFKPGRYEIEVFGSILGIRSPIILHRILFDLSDEGAQNLNNAQDAAVLYLWNPDSQNYLAKLDRRPSQGRSRSVSGSGRGRFEWE